MRPITHIILHCSATPEGRDVSAADIDRWHRLRGFAGIGYHYVIRLDGTVEKGRALSIAGAHCRGHNADSIGICYIGGLGADGKSPRDTRTKAQRAAMLAIVRTLLSTYRLPLSAVHGHNEYAPKACPCFDVRQWLREAESTQPTKTTATTKTTRSL